MFTQKFHVAAMFSGYHKLAKSEYGSYFIDADGKHFDIILNHFAWKNTVRHRSTRRQENITRVKKRIRFLEPCCLKRFNRYLFR